MELHADDVEAVARLVGAAGGYGGARVLRDIDLVVRPGELVGIVGPSGAGKTTLLRLMSGLADRHAGLVEVLGAQPGRDRKVNGLGYVPQLGMIDWQFPISVEQVVLLGADVRGRPPWFTRSERTAATGVLERLGIGELARTPIHALSGGQRQRMFVARAVFQRARLLLLDEPTSGVDVVTRREVLGVLDELRLGGVAVVLTTHDLNHVAAHLPRVVCVAGTVTADGPPSAVLTEVVLERTYGARLRVMHDRGRVVVLDDGAITASPDVAPITWEATGFSRTRARH